MDERVGGGGGQIVRGVQRRERGQGELRKDSAQRKTLLTLPCTPAVKSNSLTHSEVVALSERVTITKDTNSKVRSVRAFGRPFFPRRNNPLLANHCLDNDCADFLQTLCRLLMMSHHLVKDEDCISRELGII